MVIAVAFDHAEHAHRREMAGHSGGNQLIDDMRTVAVKVQFLLIDGHKDLQRTLGNVAERQFAHVLRFCVSRPVFDLGHGLSR